MNSKSASEETGEQLLAAEATARDDHKTAGGADDGEHGSGIFRRIVATILRDHGMRSDQHYTDSKERQKLFHEDEPLQERYLAD